MVGTTARALTKADARHVKEVLLRLPKNRRKNPLTRDLSLHEALEVPGVPQIGAVRVNGYLSDFHAFFAWAEDHDFTATNIFTGLRVSERAKSATPARRPFEQDKLQLLLRHLTHNPDQLVRKDSHK